MQETGFTTAWPPRMVTTNNSQVAIDLLTKLVTQGGSTFAAITARSYHPGGVNALFADGSVPLCQVDGFGKHLAVPRNRPRCRGHQLGCLLMKIRSSVSLGRWPGRAGITVGSGARMWCPVTTALPRHLPPASTCFLRVITISMTSRSSLCESTPYWRRINYRSPSASRETVLEG
jgi:prepilin-type processing-associated H-X9-DG protein